MKNPEQYRIWLRIKDEEKLYGDGILSICSTYFQQVANHEDFNHGPNAQRQPWEESVKCHDV